MSRVDERLMDWLASLPWDPGNRERVSGLIESTMDAIPAVVGLQVGAALSEGESTLYVCWGDENIHAELEIESGGTVEWFIYNRKTGAARASETDAEGIDFEFMRRAAVEVFA